MQKCIHFLKIKGKKFVVFTNNGKIEDKSEKFQISNIKEARAIAVKRNAIPYNFRLSDTKKRKTSWNKSTFLNKN